MISVQDTAPIETLTTGHQTLTHQAPLLQVLTLQHSVVGARCVADHPVCSTVRTPVIVIDELVSVHMLVHQSLIAQVSSAHIHSHQPPVDTGQIISQTTLDQDHLVNVVEERCSDPTGSATLIRTIYIIFISIFLSLLLTEFYKLGEF